MVYLHLKTLFFTLLIFGILYFVNEIFSHSSSTELSKVTSNIHLREGEAEGINISHTLAIPCICLLVSPKVKIYHLLLLQINLILTHYFESILQIHYKTVRKYLCLYFTTLIN